MSLEDIDFNGVRREIDSPRSLKACEELGILPEELFQIKFDEFIKNSTDMINLSKDAMHLRYNNIEIYRNKLISEVKQRRKNIMKEMEKKKEKSKANSRCDEILNDDDIMEREINDMINKGAKTLEKIRQKQKNIIEAQIESKIKKEILKLKSDKKEKLIKDLNDKIKEERRIKAMLDERRWREKEKLRQKTLEKSFKEKKKRIEEKNKAEEKRIKAFQEMQEKNHLELLFRKTQNYKLLEKRKEKLLDKLKDEQKKHKEKEEKNLKKVKELEELSKKEKEERFLFYEKREKENQDKYTKSKLKKERSIENLKKLLDTKEDLTQKRLAGLISTRHQNFQDKKIRYEKKLRSIENAIKKTNNDIQKRNDRILEHRLHIDFNVAKVEKQKNDKILERVKSQNYLFMRSVKKRENNFKKLLEKFDGINKKYEEKDKKIKEEKDQKMKNKTIKHEEDYIKDFERQHNLIRINRITFYKNKKKSEDMANKEEKMKQHKLKKQALIAKNLILGDSIEKEKVKLMEEFDSVLQKNKEIHPDIIKKLFPEDLQFYDKIKQITDDALKKYNNEKNIYNGQDKNDNLLKMDDIFLTQHNKNKNNKDGKDENE